MVLFNDAATLRYAMRADFPDGCDVWQSTRFVGRFHRPAATDADAVTVTGAAPRPRNAEAAQATRSAKPDAP